MPNVKVCSSANAKGRMALKNTFYSQQKPLWINKDVKKEPKEMSNEGSRFAK